MGLSASQARLLSITSRISDNELRSQTITTAKTSLANETTAASAAYMDALNATELNYSFYDADGTKISMPLTGAVMYEYSELKNQYGIINQHGQILVSERDAANYENSANVAEFLQKYGFANSFEQTTTTTVTKVDNDGYTEAMEEYEEEVEKLKSEEPQPTDPIYKIPGKEGAGYDYYESFMWATHICYGGTMAALCISLGLEGKKIYASDGTLILEYGKDGFVAYKEDKSGDSIGWGTGLPYKVGNAIRDPMDCYSHVFTHLLNPTISEALSGYKDYTTSTGETLRIYRSMWIMNKDGLTDPEDDQYCLWWNDESGCHRQSRAAELAEIFDSGAKPGKTILYACGDTGENITQASSEVEKLLSDYYFDENGEKKLKTMEQKIIDLDYASCNKLLSDQELYDAIEHFVNHDIKQSLLGSDDSYDEDAYEKDHDEWEEKMGNLKEPDINDFTITETLTETTIDVEAESDEGQWYINLWHRMNGPSIYKVTLEGYDNGVHDPENDGTIEGDNVKSPTNGRTESGLPLYKVLEDGLMNNAEWLQYALRNGKVTLERVDFTEPTEYGTGLDKYTWNSIQWTNAADITESQNEAAITKAEVEYEQALNDIQAKDKQYDNQLKILDTEHNALQTEYDSIKSIIEKTIERNLKLYS